MTTIQRVNTPSTFYGGITSYNSTQTNPFNMLYFQRDMNVKKEMEEQSARHNKSFHIRKTYDDTYNQLSQLYTNGRPFQQIYKPDVVSIPYRDYEDGGRNRNIFKYTDDRMVDVSGQLFRAKDIKNTPIVVSEKYKSGILGIRKLKNKNLFLY